jgi:hypothetical protein
MKLPPPSTCGLWTIQRLVISPEDSAATRLRAVLKGRGFVPPGTYTQLSHDGVLIMSDTPDEIHDLTPFIANARGRVLINGLGLGLAIALTASKVEHFTVIESDPDLLELVGHHWRALLGPRLELVHADAFEYTPPRGARYNAVWHDIWPTICADNLPDMKKLRKKYSRRAVWQGCCGEDQL